MKLFKFIAVFLLTNSSLMAQTSLENIAQSVAEHDKANVAMMKKDNETAYLHLKSAVAFDPTNSAFLNSAAYLAMTMGEFKNSIEFLNKALALDTKKFGADHPNVAAVLNNIGSVWSKEGEHKKAIEYYNKALTIIENSLGKNHPQVAAIRDIRDKEVGKLN